MVGDKPPEQPSAPAAVRATRRHDDTQRFIERFAAVTGLRAQSASIEGLPREFLARTVPAPKQLLDRHGSLLEARTYNALCRYEPGRQDLPWTYGRLLEIRGFGVFSLIDLLEVMARATHAASTTEDKSPLT
jgi:hypothetical protein